MNTTHTTRIYPQTCVSAQCGETSCPASCANLPKLVKFRAWKERTKAVQENYIWSPSVWTATVSESK